VGGAIPFQRLTEFGVFTRPRAASESSSWIGTFVVRIGVNVYDPYITGSGIHPGVGG
jgi:hypothetical protein